MEFDSAFSSFKGSPLDSQINIPKYYTYQLIHIEKARSIQILKLPYFYNTQIIIHKHRYRFILIPHLPFKYINDKIYNLIFFI